MMMKSLFWHFISEHILKTPIKIKAKDLLAEALCNEIDHLDGKLFIDIMEPGTLQYIDNDGNEK